MKNTVLTSAFGSLRRTLLLSAVASLGLAACGGGSDDNTTQPLPTTTPTTPTPPIAPVATQLSGTAAIGAPVAGATVQVRCADASAALETVTNAAGVWQANTTGQSLPCAVRVSGGNLATGQALYSAALDFGNVNVTPLTDLLIANATGTSPATWWGNNGPADFSALTATKIEKALTQLRSALALPALQNIDPRLTAFTATPKNAMDDILEALQQALKTSGITYQALLNEASKANFMMSPDFKLTLQTAHRTITVGAPDPGTNPGTAPGAPGATGAYTLTLVVTAMGANLPPVTLTNMPKPATQSEFCDELNNASSDMSLSKSIPAGTGSLTINSCSFNGTVGQVSATMTITSPMAMTVPYAVTYTYN